MNADPRYPLGPMPTPLELSAPEREEALEYLRRLPGELRAAVDGLSNTQLDTPYREGGWTVRQVVHHLAESHMNAFIRVKLALTEENPVIKPYEEDLWAELPDHQLPPEISLTLVDALHARLLPVLEGVTLTEWSRAWTHPAQGRTYTLDSLLALYAWHGRHHARHITGLREREGW